MARNGTRGDPAVSHLHSSPERGAATPNFPTVEAPVRPCADHPIASQGGRLANLRIVCSWCGDVIQPGIPGGPQARGLMCPECVKGFRNLCEGCGGEHPYQYCGAPDPNEPLPSEVSR